MPTEATAADDPGAAAGADTAADTAGADTAADAAGASTAAAGADTAADAAGRAGRDEAARPLTSTLLAEHVATRDFADPAAAGFWHVRRAIADTVACAVAGRAEPATRRLHTVLGGGAALAPWAVTGPAARADDVARINATAGHALDFDDASPAVNGHPSVVLVPALLSACEGSETLGEVAAAYAAGHEAWVLLAEALDGDDHYARGWHATSSMGTIGAAAAVARLHGLDAERTVAAIGTAASMAAGSRQNFGTMTKPLHAGMAAANGVLAARLAEAGVTADEHLIEGPFGYLTLFGRGPGDVHLPVGDAALREVGVNIKRYPCCYFVHRAVDAVLELREEGLTPDDVAGIEVIVDPGGLAALPHLRPRTGLEAKFSMPYCIASALTGGVPTLAEFTDAAATRGQITRLLPLITAREELVPPIGPPEFVTHYAVVRAETTDGAVHERRVDTARGDAARPLTDGELAVKVAGCLDAGGVRDVEENTAALSSIEPATRVDGWLAGLTDITASR